MEKLTRYPQIARTVVEHYAAGLNNLHRIEPERREWACSKGFQPLLVLDRMSCGSGTVRLESAHENDFGCS